MKRHLLFMTFLIVCSASAEQKPITVIIPSYNNKLWYKWNISSALRQQYDNYRIVYINDCSTDGTSELVYNYVQEHDHKRRTTIINNAERYGALANLYYAIHACSDEEIVVLLDGDDWFHSRHVLSRINEAYQDENVWLTYGQFRTYSDGKPGFCREIPSSVVKNRYFREYEWITSHPRTFYASLFKKIKLKDLLYKGKFFDVTWDMAFMCPMLEMAPQHFTFIPDELYTYNDDNPQSDCRKKLARQVRCKSFIVSKEKYDAVDTLEHTLINTIQLIVFSEDSPREVQEFLHTINRYAKGIDDIVVLYNADTFTHNKYQDLNDTYEEVRFVAMKGQSVETVLGKVLSTSQSDYVLIAIDRERLCAPCDLMQCAQVLQSTGAHAFYLALGSNNSLAPPMVLVKDAIFAWQFQESQFAFKQQFDAHMVVYVKDTLRKALNVIDNTHTINQLMSMLKDTQFDYEQVGLCFEYPKAKIG